MVWATKKIFHSGFPKTALNGIFLLFIPLVNIKFAFYINDFYKKRTALKKCLKNHLKILLIKLWGIPDKRWKRSFLFSWKLYKSNFCLMSSKVVYFKKHLANIARIGNEVSTAIPFPLPHNYAHCRSNGKTTPNLIERRLEKSAVWINWKRQWKEWSEAKPHTSYCK